MPTEVEYSTEEGFRNDSKSFSFNLKMVRTIRREFGCSKAFGDVLYGKKENVTA